MKPEFTKTQELVYELKVGEVMNTDLVTVTPDLEMSRLREVLRESRVSGVPVVNGDELLGIISIEDFIKWLANSESDCPLSEKMTADVEVVYSDYPLVEAVNKFEMFNYGRFPVLNRKNSRLVGMLTKGDIVEGLLRKLEVAYHEEENLRTYRASHIFEDIIADRVLLKFQYYIEGRDFKRAGESSSSLKKTLNRLGFPSEVVRRVAISIYEAEMNVVIFADKGRISVEVEPQQVKIKVHDTGPGIEDVDKALQPGYSTAGDWARSMGFGAGMGLPNIKKCSDRFDLNSRIGRGTQLDIMILVPDESESDVSQNEN